MADNFLLICDGASGDPASEVRMASYLAEMFNGWKVARRKDKESWSTVSTDGRKWCWGPDGKLTTRGEREPPIPPYLQEPV